MADNQNATTETDFYAFLNRILLNPEILKNNPGELHLILNKLMLLNDLGKFKEIRNKTYSMMKINPPPYSNPFIAVQEIRSIILNLVQKEHLARMQAVSEIQNETYVNGNQGRTAKKQADAIKNFIKG